VSPTFPTVVYILCFLTSAACAWLLGRSYLQTRARMLLGSSICFILLALNNLALVMDLVVLRAGIDLRLLRVLLALAAVCALLFAFIWNLEEE
jgi:hypothetical protein